MTLWLQPVAGHERKALLSLQLFAHQQDFIETIPEILHEADRDKTWQLLGIYQGKTLIGLAMSGLSLSGQRLGQSRITIDTGATCR